MSILDADIAMGEDSEQRIRTVLDSNLVLGSAGWSESVRAVAARVFLDLNRLPWSATVMSWLRASGEEIRAAFVLELKNGAYNATAAVGHGAALLLLALAEEGPQLDDFLFEVAQRHSDTALQRLVGAYLIGNPRTKQRAYRELEKHHALGPIVQREVRTEASIQAWRSMMRTIGSEDTQRLAAHIIETNPDFLFDLENGLLDVFFEADFGSRLNLARFVLSSLESGTETVQLFACDLLTQPDLLETAQRSAGYRLPRLLARISASPKRTDRIRHCASQILRDLQTSATVEEISIAARGNLDQLAPADRKTIVEVVKEARAWFAQVRLDQLIEVRMNVNWNYRDYAHAILTGVLGSPTRFPVQLEKICDALGIAIAPRYFETEFDGLFLQVPDAPGPVLCVNQSVQSEVRRRFTLAHEIAHAVLPWHAVYSAYLSNVFEASVANGPAAQTSMVDLEAAAAAEVDGVEMCEREADRFAAALLMPPKWFGADARQAPFSLDGLRVLREKYGVSLTAAAFNAIDYCRDAVAVVYTVSGQIRFRRMTDEFRAAVGMSTQFREWLHPEAYKSTLKAERRGEALVPSTVWFENALVDTVQEQSLEVYPHHVLTILAV